MAEIKNASSGKLQTESIEAAYLQDLEKVQADLGVVLRHHAADKGWTLVIAALVETTGTLTALLVKSDSSLRAGLLRRLDELKLFISCADQQPQ